jgi:hypothetical protein
MQNNTKVSPGVLELRWQHKNSSCLVISKTTIITYGKDTAAVCSLFSAGFVWTFFRSDSVWFVTLEMRIETCVFFMQNVRSVVQFQQILGKKSRNFSKLHNIKIHENSFIRIRIVTYWQAHMAKLVEPFLQLFVPNAQKLGMFPYWSHHVSKRGNSDESRTVITKTRSENYLYFHVKWSLTLACLKTDVVRMCFFSS